MHIDEHALHDPFQSAYRRGHSTETALLRVKNDIAETLDKKCTTILVMLDLSAAFDSVVHELLMTRLEQSFGITDKALAWLISYISERNQKVVVGSAESGGSVVTRGVPQGSVLGPILYCIYTKPIGRIITRHGMNHHCYADDLQIYLAVDRDESIVTALAKVELCVAEVAAWLTKINNNLKLNMEKSEVIMFSSAKKRDSLPADLYMTVAGHQIKPSSCVRNLGVTFDCNLRMEQQIANVVKVCYYQIRNIGRIRPHLTNESCKTLVHALVTSRLDYCNSLLYGIPNNTMQRLQRVQNCAARIITRTKKYDHIIWDQPTLSESNLQSAAIDLLCSKRGSARLPEWIVQLQTRKQNSTICLTAAPFVHTGLTDCHPRWSPFRRLLGSSMEQFAVFDQNCLNRTQF